MKIKFDIATKKIYRLSIVLFIIISNQRCTMKSIIQNIVFILLFSFLVLYFSALLVEVTFKNHLTASVSLYNLVGKRDCLSFQSFFDGIIGKKEKKDNSIRFDYFFDGNRYSSNMSLNSFNGGNYCTTTFKDQFTAYNSHLNKYNRHFVDAHKQIKKFKQYFDINNCYFIVPISQFNDCKCQFIGGKYDFTESKDQCTIINAHSNRSKRHFVDYKSHFTCVKLFLKTNNSQFETIHYGLMTFESHCNGYNRDSNGLPGYYTIGNYHFDTIDEEYDEYNYQSNMSYCILIMDNSNKDLLRIHQRIERRDVKHGNLTFQVNKMALATITFYFTIVSLAPV